MRNASNVSNASNVRDVRDVREERNERNERNERDGLVTASPRRHRSVTEVSREQSCTKSSFFKNIAFADGVASFLQERT